jgi:hypothetical protein
VRDRRRFSSFAEAETALAVFVDYYNYRRLSGTVGWRTPGERYDGTTFSTEASRTSQLSLTSRTGSRRR